MSKNSHLNLFRFYNENTEKEFIENNLSRAFAICLSNNSFFLNEYLQDILSREDYEYLFSSFDRDMKYEINMQVDTAGIEQESFKTVYAVAMTGNRNLDMDDFFKQLEFSERKNITDILVIIKDIAIIIEVKRTWEDCKAQLYNQVLPFIKEKDKYTVKPVCYSWPQVIRLMEKVNHAQKLVSQHTIFLNDFLELSQSRYPEWFEPKPFNVIPFSTQWGTVEHNQLMKRMRHALAGVAAIAGDDYHLLPYNDRLGIAVPFGWASELIPNFQVYDKEAIKENIVFYIWPGNTKQQGYAIFSKSMNWLQKETLTVDGVEYPLHIAFNVKLCHFNRFISEISFYEEDVIAPLHTSDNFYNQSGKWDSNLWNDFEMLMDEHFKPEFNWREKCGWEKNFVNTDRSYFTMSLGFEVSIAIPYSTFKAIDKTGSDINKVIEKINAVVNAFRGLIDAPVTDLTQQAEVLITNTGSGNEISI